MGSIAKLYGTVIRDEIELHATWPIGTALDVGDVGFLTRRGKLFERWGNLADFGIVFSSVKAPTASDFEFSFGKRVDVQFKAAGQIPVTGSPLTQAQAGATIKLSRGSALHLVAHTEEESLANLSQLERDLLILAANPSSGWKRDFVVVTAAYQSKGTTVVVSTGEGSTIGIAASAGVGVPFDLADASIGLSASMYGQKLVKALAKPGFVPFVRIHHLVGGLFSKRRLARYG